MKFFYGLLGRFGSGRSPRTTGERTTSSLAEKSLAALLGLLFFLLCLELVLRLEGFACRGYLDGQNRKALDESVECRILCVGESTTLWGGAGSYPAQLGEILNERCPGKKFSVVNRGLGGANSSAILLELEDNLRRYRPHIVVAMMGANDQDDMVPFAQMPAVPPPSFLDGIKVCKFMKILWFNIARAGALKAEMAYDKGKRLLLRPRAPRQESPGKPLTREEEALLRLTKLNAAKAKWPEAAEAYRKATELNPRCAAGYLGLADICCRQGDFTMAKSMCEKAVASAPELMPAYRMLGTLLLQERDYVRAVEVFGKMVELDPCDLEAAMHLADCLEERGRTAEALQVYRRVIEINPRHSLGFIRCLDFCERRNLRDDAEKLIARINALDVRDSMFYARMAKFFHRAGNREMEERYRGKADDLQAQYYHPMTRRNYLDLRAILERHGVALVCVQYPRRDVEPLKRIFSESAGLVFVDNRASFEKQLQTAEYEEIFCDNLYGDIGHGTKRGNRLLAENVAEALVTHGLTGAGSRAQR